MSQKTIDVLIVDDSNLIRAILSDIVSSIPTLRVCNTATNGIDALDAIKKNAPDVILLDLEMPKMDGFTFLKKVMETNPIPIIIVSNYSEKGSEIVLDCLECGAVDYLSLDKVNCDDSLKILKSMLGLKIKNAVLSHPEHIVPKNIKRISKLKNYNGHAAKKVVVIGGSTGGIRGVSEIISKLPENLDAGVLVVQHILEFLSGAFAKRLSGLTSLNVKEAKEGDIIKNGLVLVAPGGFHMKVTKTSKISLNDGPKRYGLRPTVNMTMVTASETFLDNTVGVILSGMGDDGAFGMQMIKKRGGVAMAQNKETSVVFGMPDAAKKIGAVNTFYSPAIIAKKIVEHVGVI